MVFPPRPRLAVAGAAAAAAAAAIAPQRRHHGAHKMLKQHNNERVFMFIIQFRSVRPIAAAEKKERGREEAKLCRQRLTVLAVR